MPPEQTAADAVQLKRLVNMKAGAAYPHSRLRLSDPQPYTNADKLHTCVALKLLNRRLAAQS